MNPQSIPRKLWRFLCAIPRRAGAIVLNLTGYREKRLLDVCRKYAVETGAISVVHPQDHIFRFLIENPVFSSLDKAVKYYFQDGQQSARMLGHLLFTEMELARSPETTLLEFASGYGCVTRHLAGALSPVNIVACDIHGAACDFIERTLATNAILSSARPEDLAIESGSYDAVFALSFFSHMPELTWSRWLVCLFDKVKPGGYLIFTTQGLQSRKHFGNPVIPENGIWHIPSSEQKDLDAEDYGNTIVTTEFVRTAVDRHLHQPITMLKEAHWWGHQDLYVLRKSDPASVSPAPARHAGCDQIG